MKANRRNEIEHALDRLAAAWRERDAAVDELIRLGEIRSGNIRG